MSSPSFIKSAVLVVLGSILAQMLTQYGREIYDVQVRGGDALYAAVSGLLVMAVLPGKYGRPLALGASASAVRTVLDQYDLI